jgi:TPR repeat protein
MLELAIYAMSSKDLISYINRCAVYIIHSHSLPHHTCVSNCPHTSQPYAQTAVHYFQQAAAQGHPIAQNMLGLCYATGQGVPAIDDCLAEKYYRQAAQQGLQIARTNLETILERRGAGIGIAASIPSCKFVKSTSGKL